jgi:hypothetical protein
MKALVQAIDPPSLLSVDATASLLFYTIRKPILSTLSVVTTPYTGRKSISYDLPGTPLVLRQQQSIFSAICGEASHHRRHRKLADQSVQATSPFIANEGAATCQSRHGR